MHVAGDLNDERLTVDGAFADEELAGQHSLKADQKRAASTERQVVDLNGARLMFSRQTSPIKRSVGFLAYSSWGGGVGRGDERRQVASTASPPPPQLERRCHHK